MSASNGEKNVRVTRKSLKTLQQVASDSEIAGRPKNLKHQHSQDSFTDNSVTSKNSRISRQQTPPESSIDNMITNKSSRNSRQQTPPENSIKVDATNKYATKEVQVNLDNLVTEDDLTNPQGASKKYWKLLAEKRLVSLQEACDENGKLREIINDLKQENALYKQMLEEANSFVEVIKEELANRGDDTGIDVNDVSTADDTINIDEDNRNGH